MTKPRSICTIPWCPTATSGNGLCNKHLLRKRRKGSPFALKRESRGSGDANGMWNGGSTTHPLYHTWGSMKKRCSYPGHGSYSSYGGRVTTQCPEGIYVCDRWRENFWLFVEDVGACPSPEMSLDRIDNDGPYHPDNIHWATPKEQAANKRPRRK